MGSAVTKCSCVEDHQIDRVDKDSDESLPPISSLYVPYQDRHRFIYDDTHLLGCDDQKISLKEHALVLCSPAQKVPQSNSHGAIDYQLSPRSLANDPIPSNIAESESESDQESVMTFVSPSKDRTSDGNAR